MRLEDQELERLVRDGESFRMEWKESLGGRAPEKIRQAICAFANDLPTYGKPGLIIVGLDDDGHPVGTPIDDDLLLSLANMKGDGTIVPPPALVVEKRMVQGKEVAVITVSPSASPPVRYKGAIYVRTGPSTVIASADDERILAEKRRRHNAPFDIAPVLGLSLDVLNKRQFEEEYLPQAFSPEILDANERSLEQRLSATKMIAGADDPTPTILGLLVLGRETRDYIPCSYVQFLRIDGTSLADSIIDEAEIDGTLQDILSRLDDKIRAHIREQVDLTSTDREKRSQSYPLAALQQLTRNAIMHRSYEATNAPIRITWFNDHIEILSPGGPFGIVNADNFGKPGITDYRNPNLAEAMKVLGYVQRFGVGIATARKLLLEAGHPEPEFQTSLNTVHVTVWGKAP